MNTKHFFPILAALIGVLVSGVGRTQAISPEDFTGTTTVNSWYFSSGACLTAGTGTSTISPGPLPGCQTVGPTYAGYIADTYLYGGSVGYLGGSTAPGSLATETPDAAGSGALRFTNGSPAGYGEKGSIISVNTFDTSQGLQVTFKTVTYRGDSGSNTAPGGASDGADGMSFFVMDGSAPALNNIGPSGGTLAYSCSNQATSGTNAADGLRGAYLGLGIDEFG